MLVYVDTNALIAALEGDDDVAELARTLLASGSKHNVDFVTSELTLGELLVGPLRSDDTIRTEAIFALFASNQTLKAAPIDRDIVVAAADLRASYQSLKWPDAVHLATAAAQVCTHFWSNDHRIPDTGEFEFVRLNKSDLQTLMAKINS